MIAILNPPNQPTQNPPLFWNKRILISLYRYERIYMTYGIIGLLVWLVLGTRGLEWINSVWKNNTTIAKKELDNEKDYYGY